MFDLKNSYHTLPDLIAIGHISKPIRVLKTLPVTCVLPEFDLVRIVKINNNLEFGPVDLKFRKWVVCLYSSIK